MSTATKSGKFQGTAASDETVTPNLAQRCAGLVFSSILRALSASWRVEIQGVEILDELAQSKRSHILAFWHRYYITLFELIRDRPVVVVTNQSSRGNVIADICHRNGMRTIQAGGDGRKAMLATIARATSDGYGLGIAVDGPLGPAETVKRVVPHLASRLNLPVVPVAITSQRKYVFTNRWDGLEIPYPFSRVTFAIGRPIEIASEYADLTSREQAVHLQNEIMALGRQVRGQEAISTEDSDSDV